MAISSTISAVCGRISESSAPLLASSALTEALEIAYSTAEHHPYWAILYHSAEICKTVLDSWDEQISVAQSQEITWRSDEIKGAVERLAHG